MDFNEYERRKKADEEKWKKAAEGATKDFFSRLMPQLDARQTEYVARRFGLRMESPQDLAIVRSVRATYEGFVLLGWQMEDRGQIPRRTGETWAEERTREFLMLVATKGMGVFVPDTAELVKKSSKPLQPSEKED